MSLVERKFSPSGVNGFYYCPKQWELHHKITVTVPVDNIALEFGAFVHNVIKEYFDLITNKPTGEQIEKVFRTVFDENFERNSFSHLKERAEKIRDNFIKFEKERLKEWSVYKPTLVETKLNNETYVTIVDFYSAPMETLIDWKTGNKNDITDDDLRQGKIMELVLKSHEFKVSRILFVALYPNRRFEIPHIGDGFVENEVRKMQDSIKTNYFPKSGRFCWNCDVVLDCQLEGCCLWLV